MRADLHTHSTASDGQYTPSELAALAKQRGIEVWALTDHDTLDGLEEAAQAGEALGLRVVRGVEFSAKEYPTFHILGYGFRPSGLAELCAEMATLRDQRKERIRDYLREKGVDIPLDEVLEAAGSGVIGRPHFARVMVRHGYVSSNKEAFDRYLDTPEYHDRLDYGKPAARRCVETIRNAGGHAALAHPYQIGLDDTALDTLAGKMRDWGLDAIECYYPRHTEAQTAFYLRLAAKHGLHPTGGSDFHGERVKPDISLATWNLDLNWLLP